MKRKVGFTGEEMLDELNLDRIHSSPRRVSSIREPRDKVGRARMRRPVWGGQKLSLTCVVVGGASEAFDDAQPIW